MKYKSSKDVPEVEQAEQLDMMEFMRTWYTPQFTWQHIENEALEHENLHVYPPDPGLNDSPYLVPDGHQKYKR